MSSGSASPRHWHWCLVPRVPVADHVVQHAVTLVRASRPEDRKAPEIVRKNVAFGAGPRASQGLVLGAKARALMYDRYNVSYEDIRALAKPVLRHRILTNFHAESENVKADTIIERLLDTVKPSGSGV